MTGAPAQETSDLHFGRRITWETIHRLCINKRWPPWRNNMVHASRSLSDCSVNSLSRTIWIVSRDMSPSSLDLSFRRQGQHFPLFSFFSLCSTGIPPNFQHQILPRIHTLKTTTIFSFWVFSRFLFHVLHHFLRKSWLNKRTAGPTVGCMMSCSLSVRTAILSHISSHFTLASILPSQQLYTAYYGNSKCAQRARTTSYTH